MIRRTAPASKGFVRFSVPTAFGIPSGSVKGRGGGLRGVYLAPELYPGQLTDSARCAGFAFLGGLRKSQNQEMARWPDGPISFYSSLASAGPLALRFVGAFRFAVFAAALGARGLRDLG